MSAAVKWRGKEATQQQNKVMHATAKWKEKR